MPINIDGSAVSSVTIDGDSVREVTVDGSTVFNGISVVEQWVATEYQNDEWIGQINGINLTGGSATVGTDANGNTAVEYDGSGGQAHDTTALSVAYNRIVVASVVEFTNPGGGDLLWGDPTRQSIFLQNDSGGVEVAWDENSGNQIGSTVASGDPEIIIAYGPGFNTTNDEVEINGTTTGSGNAGATGLTGGFILGNRGNKSGNEVSAKVVEQVLYQDPSESDINSERQRMANSYGITL